MWQDASFALRGFRSHPGFTLTALAVLSLGIGAGTVIFSVADSMLLKPLAMAEPDRVVQLMLRNPRFDIWHIRPMDLGVWRRETRLFEDVTAYSYVAGEVSLTGGERPEQVPAEHVSHEYFRLFGARPALGRFFSPEEDRPHAGNFVVISHGLWERRFGSNPSIVGQSMRLGDEPFTIVGVANSGFRGDRPVDLWLPLQADPSNTVAYLWGAARLHAGVRLAQAKSALRLAADAQRRASPETMPNGLSYTAAPMADIVTGDVRPSILVLLVAVGGLLLIACTNVGNLFLVRAGGRGREIAIRAALGARRGRIARQLLTESVILSLAGGLVGLLVAAVGIRALPALEPMTIPRIGPGPAQINLNGAALGVSALLSILTGILFGLAPALFASRADLQHTLKQGGTRTGGSGQRLRGDLVIAEVALAVMLLAGAGVMIRSWAVLRSEPLGFDPHHVLVFDTALTGPAYDRTAGLARAARQAEDRLRAVAGVQAVSAEDSVPLVPNLNRAFTIEGRPAAPNAAPGGTWRAVTPGYFAVFKIRVLAGRGLTSRDTARAPHVVVINQTMARRYWRGQDPIGQRISFLSEPPEPPAEIVGVVDDVREINLKDPQYPAAYVPLAQVDDRFLADARVWMQSLSWTVRTNAAPASILPAIREAIRNATGLPVGHVRQMDDIVASSMEHDSSQTAIFGFFALSAILLASIGLHGMLAYSVQQRTFEFGIRLALGAGAKELRRMILRQAVRYAGIGILIGVGGAFGLTRLMRALLFGVEPWDPLVFTAVPILLALVALAACYGPARRVTNIDPIVAMRYE